MAESSIYGACDECQPDRIKEAVCINASRIYDSCSDKDCLEDLPVLLTKPAQCMIDKAINVRLGDVRVSDVNVGLQPVPFHKGFYAVDMTFYYDVCLDVYMAPSAMPMQVKGLSVFGKRAVLFGSDGGVRVFTSDNNDSTAVISDNCPRAVVQVAEPIPLSARLVDHGSRPPMPPFTIPDCILRRYGGEFSGDDSEKEVLASIGMFTIVQLERQVQMMVPVYDFCIPHKECVSTSEDPCELFDSIEFPTGEFFPNKG